MNAPKIAVIAVWLLLASGFVFAPESGLSRITQAGFWLMLVAHGVEFVIFRSVFEGAPGTQAQHLIQTLIFGVVHVREVRAAAAGGASEV